MRGEGNIIGRRSDSQSEWIHYQGKRFFVLFFPVPIQVNFEKKSASRISECFPGRLDLLLDGFVAKESKNEVTIINFL